MVVLGRGGGGPWASDLAVVAGRAGGIPLQMSDGVGGFLVDSVEGCAQAILRLLRDEQLSTDLGQKGKERVREHFLLPRLLLNELSLVRDLMGGLTRAPGEMDGRRDPVCGMAISDPEKALKMTYTGLEFSFCSEGCRGRFLATPERYVAARQRA